MTRIRIEGADGERCLLPAHFIVVALSRNGDLLEYAQSTGLDKETADELLAEARKKSKKLAR